MDKLTTAVSPADVAVASDVAGLARLKSAARENSPEALEAVAQQFESLFLEMMLKSMREASLGDGIFDSEAGDLYQGMFDKQVALDLSRGKGLGIAELLIRQLAPTAPAEDGGVSSLPTLGGAFQSLPDTRLVKSSPKDRQERHAAVALHATPAEFVRELLPHARRAAAELGVHPLGLIAQAAIETGWGKSVIARADGSSSFNLFGIKAGEEWSGPKAVTRTLEFEGGLPVAKQASFRSYESIAASFDDYVKLLRTSPRYRDVLEQGADPTRFAESIGRSGYATDPAYAAKLKGLLDSDTLRGAVAALKNPEVTPI